MDNLNPILLVSLTCCIGPLLFGGTCFTVGRWSTRWRLTLNRRSYAEAQAHSEAVGYGDSAGLPPQAPPPAMPRTAPPEADSACAARGGACIVDADGICRMIFGPHLTGPR
jgi:hypothetical protein